jgi:hypothetical protein
MHGHRDGHGAAEARGNPPGAAESRHQQLRASSDLSFLYRAAGGWNLNGNAAHAACCNWLATVINS